MDKPIHEFLLTSRVREDFVKTRFGTRLTIEAVLSGKIKLLSPANADGPHQKVPSTIQPFLTRTAVMAITILAPTPAGVPYPTEESSDSEDGGADLEGDLDIRPSKRARHQKDIVTPGEIVTDDPQWMRYLRISKSISSFQTIPANDVPEATARSSRLPLPKL